MATKPFVYQDPYPLGEDKTRYRKVEGSARERHRAHHGNVAGHAGGGHDDSRHRRAGARATVCLTLGIMGVLTPFATGPSPVYYGSGYPPAKDYWRLGAIFGAFFIAVMLIVAVPWLALIQ